MKFDQTLISFVSKDIKNGKVPMLIGEPGIGKSSWIEDLAKSLQTQCFTLAVNQLADKADLTGARLVPTADGKNYKQVFYPHEVIMDAVQYAEDHNRETPILFLDEINRTTADVTSAALSIPTLRRIGSIQLPANLKVIIAGNDKGNVASLDEASISRFVLYRVAPDPATFLQISPNLNIFVKNVITKQPQLLFCKSIEVANANAGGDDDDDNNNSTLIIDDILMDGEGMQQISTPRTVTALSDWLNEFKNDELVSLMATPATVEGIETNVLMEGIVGHIGYTNLAVAIAEEIRVGINTVSNNAVSNTPVMPQCWQTLKSQPDVVQLDNFVSTMTKQELSASLVYAIYEKVDNAAIINALVKSPNMALEPADMTMLMGLISNVDYDADNWKILINSGSPIGTMMEMFDR